jgi:hypothetical protein
VTGPVRYWKFLHPGRVSPFAGYTWPRPGTWVTASAAEPCRRGIHACRLADLPFWLLDELWQVELAEPVLATPSKVVAARARLVAQVDGWDAATADEFGRACVGRTVMHAVEELRAAGLTAEAARLAAAADGGQTLDRLAGVAGDLAESAADTGHRPAGWLCGYVVDAVELLGEAPVASIAFVAARAAGRRSGDPGWEPDVAERAWQAQWLDRRLALTTDRPPSRRWPHWPHWLRWPGAAVPSTAPRRARPRPPGATGS